MAISRAARCEALGRLRGEPADPVSALNLSLDELKDWNCCGATSYMSIDEGSRVLSARICRARARPATKSWLLRATLLLGSAQDPGLCGAYPQIAKRRCGFAGCGELPPLDGVQVRHPMELLYNDVGLERIKSKVVATGGGASRPAIRMQWCGPFFATPPPSRPTRMD